MSQPPPVEPAGGAPVSAEPVCPRHPDRISYVRCQRCGRPTCPDCQRPAAVGIQCVDCVREQARATPQGTTVFGGRATSGTPVVTYAIIGACVLVFLLQEVLGDRFTVRFAFAPVVARSEPWRFLTSAFLHSTSFLPHILFNMVVLYQVGPYLERAFGRLRYAVLYLVCGVGGSVGYLVLADPLDPSSWSSAVVGASGAVFGLFGALLMVQRRLRQDLGGIYAVVGINLLLGFVIGGIAWQAHVGGLVTGLALGAVLTLPTGRWRTALHVGGSVAVVVLLVAVSAAKLASAAPL